MNDKLWTQSIVVSAVVVTLASSARATDVDWKLYGGESLSGSELCFYDANDVIRTSSGYVRVWTKCLGKKDLDGIDPKSDLGIKIVDTADRKIDDGYVPPIVVVGQMEFQQIPEITAAEEAANLGNIAPNAHTFYELNCTERMIRTLSIFVRVNGKSSFKNTPSEWENAPPESNSAKLIRLLCSRQ